MGLTPNDAPPGEEDSRQLLVELCPVPRVITPPEDLMASRGSVQAAGGIPGVRAIATDECSEHMRVLADQLKELLFTHRPETVTDPGAQPLVWISSWVDCSNKYGFGYKLCDDSVGVLFNDETRILLSLNATDVHYIERDGTEFNFTVGTTPSHLTKKMKLWHYFNRYMNVHLAKAGAGFARGRYDQHTRVPHLHTWIRTDSAVTMRLTNGTVQVNFIDHRKIIVCPLMSAVTYINASNDFRTFRLSTLESYASQPQCAGLASSLQYVYKNIPHNFNNLNISKF